MGPLKAIPDPGKALLRNEIAARISALSVDEKKRQSHIVYEKLTNHPWYKAANRIALYMSTDQEVDTAPIIEHLTRTGAAAFVPQYAGGVMVMLRLQTGDKDSMAVTKHGIAQHSKDQVREDALQSGGLDLIIAPGVAFTKAGARLGHGGGYYDKYLANVRSDPHVKTKVVALAFRCQVVEELPLNEQDQLVDDVISA